MTRIPQKSAAQERSRYWQNPEPHRERARARKTRILIDRARREALRELANFNLSPVAT